MFHLNEMFNLWCWLLKCDKTQENSFTNGEDLIEIWDKAHYYEEEKKKLHYGPDSTGKILVKTISMWSFILLWLAVCPYVVHQCVPITTDQIILLLTSIAVYNH